MKLKTIILGITAIACSFSLFAQNPSSSQFSIQVKNGSVAQSLSKYEVKREVASASLLNWFGLSDNYSFEKLDEKSDRLGFVQEKYQQYFKGIAFTDGMVILHSKNGLATSINGRISKVDEKMDIAHSLNVEYAIQSAKKDLDIATLTNNYPAQLVILKQRSNEEHRVAWKVRIDGKNKNGKLLMFQVFVDANNGKILEKFSLMAHADVLANATTLYNGTQIITTDSFENGYRLRDSSRNIETYDVGGSPVNYSMSNPFLFDSLLDVVNLSTTWDEIPTLMSISLDSTNSGYLSGLGQTTFLLSFVADAPPVNLDDFNALTYNPLFSVTGPASLPVSSNGLFLPLPKPAYSAGFSKISVNMSTFDLNILDSAYFSITDKNLGIHPWNDAAGNKGTYSMELKANPAIDAHWGMAKTHDYYMDRFSQNSFDGHGSVIHNYMNGMLAIGNTQMNAAAIPAPYNSMVYGLGDGELFGPLVGLDVMGHEFTHLITGNSANLNYQGESGALNESFSDIMGTAIEFYAKGDSAANWTIGEGIVLQTPGHLRSMSAPKSLASSGNPNFPPQPDTYKKSFWVNTSSNNDNGGVHTNSGVGNKWFYLLTEGGTGTNDNQYQYDVTGIGMEKSEQIAFRTLTSYLTPTSQYIDALYASLQAAEDLFGDTSMAYQSVKKAWFAVGVLDSIALGVGPMDELANSFQVYPNPNTGQFVIQNDFNTASAEIVTITGSVLKTFSLKRGSNAIDISEFSKGIYILNIQSEKGRISKKISLH